MLVIDCGSKRTPLIVEQLFMLGHKPCVVHIDFLQPEHVDGMSGIVLSGSPRMLSRVTPTFFERYEFLTSVSVPVFGICFGHQLIGMLHGASVMTDKHIQGPVEIWLEDDPLFAGIDPVTAFVQDHEEHITVPESFIRIASSNETEVEAMRHKTRPIYSVQFHPEISGEVGFRVLENFAKLCTYELMH